MTEGEGRIEQEALRGNAVKADVMVGRKGQEAAWALQIA